MNGGRVRGLNGGSVAVDKMFLAAGSVLFDAVFVPGGSHADVLRCNGNALNFINEAYSHCKPIGATGEGVKVLREARLPNLPLSTAVENVSSDKGVVTAGRADGTFARSFIEAISHHRHWNRVDRDAVPA